MDLCQDRDGEKRNHGVLTRRSECRKNYKFENGIYAHYQRASETEEEEPWRICVRTETEKSKIVES